MKRLLLALLLFVSVQGAAQAQEEYVDKRHVQCIGHIVYGESKNEPLEGQFAVAWSVIFRAAVDRADFGGSDFCDVAYKRSLVRVPGRPAFLRWQYDGAKVAVRDLGAWETAVWVAQKALQGHGQPDMPIMYFCSVHVRSACRWHDKDTTFAGKIGGHRFYTDPLYPKFQLASNVQQQ